MKEISKKEQWMNQEVERLSEAYDVNQSDVEPFVMVINDDGMSFMALNSIQGEHRKVYKRWIGNAIKILRVIENLLGKPKLTED